MRNFRLDIYAAGPGANAPLLRDVRKLSRKHAERLVKKNETMLKRKATAYQYRSRKANV
jgi:hypothetical protein